MKTNNYLLYLLIILTATLLASCKFVEYFQQDSFYRNGSEFDHLRFPLLKPYYAIYIENRYGWVVPLEAHSSNEDIYYYIQLHDIQKIAIEQGAVMIYTPYKESVEESVGQKVLYWFVLIPDEKIEAGFDNEKDFLAYIKKYDIEQPSWRTPDNILKEYNETWCLEWIPTCSDD